MALDVSARNATEGVQEILLAFIKPSPLNPRKTFAEGPLQELADSIREHGILEPLVLRSNHGQYEIIAGERRFRAAKLAGLKAVPAVVRSDVDDALHLKLALVENLQRSDLDPIEEAEGLKRLAAMGMRQTEIAAAVNKSAPAVSNSLRLLDLPEDVKGLIRDGKLTAAHGKALASMACNATIQSKIAAVAARDELGSKDVERFWHRRSWNMPDEIRDNFYVLDHSAVFNRAECLSCPHDAYRNGGGDHYCLRPACYEEKQKAAKAAQKQKAEEQAKAAKVTGLDGIPLLSSMGYTTYQQLGYSTDPSVCSDACPSRGKARDSHGRIISICTSPATYRKEMTADTRAKNKAGKVRQKELQEQLAAKTERMMRVGIKELAILVAQALRNHSSSAIRQACDHHKCLGHEQAFNNGYMLRREQLEKLATLDPVDLVKVAMEAIILDQLHNMYDLRNCGSIPDTDWYLEADKPEVLTTTTPTPTIQTESRGCTAPVTHALRWKHADGKAGTAFACDKHTPSMTEQLRQPGGHLVVEALESAAAGKLSCSSQFTFWQPGGEL